MKAVEKDDILYSFVLSAEEEAEITPFLAAGGLPNEPVEDFVKRVAVTQAVRFNRERALQETMQTAKQSSEKEAQELLDKLYGEGK